ncbi:MAG TPA: hypothetical protein VMC83_28250 [Streptosporangiaceae bacterium]|nr:hypothetical protein [Streptosporangiaceae bacterium]
MVIHALHDIKTGIGFALLAYILLWVLTFVIMVALLGVLHVSRGNSDTGRDVFRQIVASRSSRDLVHVGDQAGSLGVEAAMRRLQSFDPDFDATVFLDCARVVVGAYAMAQMGKDDRLLRRITTPGFWQTVSGRGITNGIAQHERLLRKHPESARSSVLTLDVSWRQPVVQAVALGERGVDRITVRLASVFIGLGPDRKRVDMATQLDWDFVRPASTKTDPGAVLQPRTCASCGAPYRSEMDGACAYCHAPRADAQAGWRLDRNYLVVQTSQ